MIDLDKINDEEIRLLWLTHQERLIKLKPTAGEMRMLNHLKHPSTSSEMAERLDHGSVQSVSMSLKSLYDKGYVLRVEIISDTGGIEYLYSV